MRRKWAIEAGRNRTGWLAKNFTEQAGLGPVLDIEITIDISPLQQEVLLCRQGGDFTRAEGGRQAVVHA
jgi:hypothetical protein